MTSSRILLCSAVALLLALQDLRAAPLDADTCSKLDAERLQLEFAGARTNMAKGPESAKAAKLPADTLNQVRRLIDVDALLLFRCTGGGLVNLPADAPDPEPAGTPREPGEEGKETPEPAGKETVPPAKAKPDTTKKAATSPPGKAPDAKTPSASKGQPAKKTPADKDKGPEKKAKTDKAPAPQAKGPAPKAKPKTDDAYKPPAAPDPNSNPFAGKAAPPAK
jgi:hypothetical protein